ncbi:biotin-dependent carboxyltransferase family protein [Aliiroseovarius sp.]|uniref:5-oxoprolinase subunit C family protein n=1 Tax=Aliiroseovarius sp. TaxID=1872442 RepID=UPI002639EB17|nr:biotin-dependent carboxyltransferase family protein [Aliiroseovarius sp.]
MSFARFTVRFAGPLVTFQDRGRPGHKRFGVSASGPMDRLAHAAANVALGQLAGATAIEVSMGGIVLACTEGAVSLAVAGGEFGIDLAGSGPEGWAVLTIEAGQTLTLRPGRAGSWCYIAFAGELQCGHWLGHAATHSTSGLGGGALVTGQELEVANTRTCPDREGPIAQPAFARFDGTARVVMGPQDDLFDAAARTALTTETFQLTDAFDRMGVRLDGPRLSIGGALSIPSEPVARGSIQVAGDGVATVLLADHQTTGGYPKIATVIGPDQDGLAQLRARDALRFKAITPAEAVAAARTHAAARVAWLAEIATPRGTLMERLMRENLVDGVVRADSDS